MIKELGSWTEVTRGLYRYVIAANVCYEIHILYWEDGTDILTAKSALYIVGNWTRLPDHISYFSREILVDEAPLFECLKAAEFDYKENMK